MNAFAQKKIDSIESLGEKLKNHRQEMGLTIIKVANLLNINSRYLRALEEDDYEKLPSEIYTKNIINDYAKFLRLNPISVIALFEKEKQIYNRISKINKTKVKKKTRLNKLLHIFLKPQTIKYSFIALAFLLVLGYIAFSINKIFTPPELIITEPFEQSIITSEQSITIAGITEKETELTINNKQILCDENGRFELLMDLQKDLNIIKISSKKKHSNPNIVYRQIIVQEN